MSMKWKKGNEYFLKSEDGRFLIARTKVCGTVCYTASKAGSGGIEDVLHIERGLPPGDDGARLAAVDRCKAACESVSHV